MPQETKDEILSVRFEAGQVESLRVCAKEHERTVAAEIRLAVRRYLAEVAA